MKSINNLTRLLIVLAGLFNSAAFAQTRSYTQQDVIKVSGVTTDAQVTALPQSSKRTTRTYLDGMGRSIQTVAVQASPNHFDVVQPLAYDNLGRQSTGYLPYVAGSTDGSYHANAISTEQPAFYNNGVANKVADDNSPYSQQVFENSPLQRLLKAGSVGANYQPVSGQHFKTVNYRNNTTADAVVKWKNVSNVLADGFYDANTLSVTDGVDEQGVETLAFTDRNGSTILKRQVKGTNDFLDTYYMYTPGGAIAYIIPPKAVALLKAANVYNLNNTNVDPLVFKYLYDDRGRLISKKVPRAGEMRIVYDPYDRPVLLQDANLKAQNKWNYIKYDAENRAISQGLYTDAAHTTAESMQAHVDSLTDGYYLIAAESRANDAANGYYTNTAFPSQNIEPLAYSYFDDYDLDRNGSPDYQYQTQTNFDGQATEASALIRGMTTIVRKRTLGSGLANLWLTSVTFYDDRGRVLQTIGNNHLQATISDAKTVITDFEGKTLFTKVVKVAGSTTTKVKTAYSYDDGGRVTAVDQYYNDATISLRIAAYQYNELGQLVKKSVGVSGQATGDNIVLNSPVSGNTVVVASQSITLAPGFTAPAGVTFGAGIAKSLQDIDYRYNIRGQLTNINNSALSNDGITNNDGKDLFGMEFIYDQPVAGLGNTQYYNGRVGAIKWRTKDPSGNAGNERFYKYTYDNVNRLTDANYQEYTGSSWVNIGAYNESGITYDENGNIKALQRNALNAANSTVAAVDNLTYNYDTNDANRLLSVSDATGNTFGFNNRMGASTNYTYDDNGNLLNDPFKGMALTYNEANRVNQITVTSGNGSSGGKLVYTYDAASTLLRKQRYNASNVLQKTTDYSDGFVYEDGALAYFAMPEGRVRNVSGTLKNEYIITDQQGNSRISFEDDGAGNAKIVQENSYYAFGMVIPNSAVSTPTQPNKNLYNGGSEIQDDLGGLPDLMQTFFRNYDAALGRWTGVDPKADALSSLNPYNYSGNDPIMMNDPMGDLFRSWDEVQQAIDNIQSHGRYGGTATGVNEFSTYNSANDAFIAGANYIDANNMWGQGGIASSYYSAAMTYNLSQGFNENSHFVDPNQMSRYTVSTQWFRDANGGNTTINGLSASSIVTDNGVQSSASVSQGGIGQPGTWESIIPVWGSGRAAIDDFQNGNYWTGTLHTALAISDVFLVKAAYTAIAKAAVVGVGKLAVEQGGKELYNFSLKAASHMENPARAVPIQILDQAIKGSTGIIDSRGSDALMHTVEMWKNGNLYNLEILYHESTNSIWHFKYY